MLWRKDSFCDLVEVISTAVQPAAPPPFLLPCWLLPRSRSQLQRQISLDSQRQNWIVKPMARGEGRGIFVAETMDEITRMIRLQGDLHGRGRMVQRLLSNPLLLGGRKFDLRLYVLVTSVSPLRAYIHRRGIVRFAAQAYDKDARRGGRVQQWLTNTAINKRFASSANLTRTLKALYHELELSGYDASTAVQRMDESIASLLLGAEERLLRASVGRQREGCYQLLGVDVIFDEGLQPYIIEVNGLPSMQTTLSGPEDPSYVQTKNEVVRDVLQVLLDEPPTSGILASIEQVTGTGFGTMLKMPGMTSYAVAAAVEAHLAVNTFRPLYPVAKPAALSRYVATGINCTLLGQECCQDSDQCRGTNAHVQALLLAAAGRAL